MSLKNENELKYSKRLIYTEWITATGIINYTHDNQDLVKLFPDIVGNAFQWYKEDL